MTVRVFDFLDALHHGGVFATVLVQNRLHKRMSALGHKQTFAVHQPMSAKCQKRTSGKITSVQELRPARSTKLEFFTRCFEEKL